MALAPEPPAPAENALRVVVSGARGGHSGEDIASGRANAIKSLGRVLSAGFRAAPFRLTPPASSASRNAIPRDAAAVIVVPAAGDALFRAAVETELAALVRQYAGTDDGLTLSVEPAAAGGAASLATTETALDLVAAIPTGVVALDPVGRTVQTSSCLTVASTEDGTLTLSSMSRSSNAAALDGVLAATHALARLADADIEARRSYPPWEPDLDSELLATAKATHERLFGSEPALTVVHGGLECAVLGQRLPAVEMVSIGPEIVGPHAPGEKVRVSSTERFYRVLGALLDDLSR